MRRKKKAEKMSEHMPGKKSRENIVKGEEGFTAALYKNDNSKTFQRILSYMQVI
ncbi:MAG: hypothetical protein V8S26_09605 [Lachnospiraceae bacterium]